MPVGVLSIMMPGWHRQMSSAQWASHFLLFAVIICLQVFNLAGRWGQLGCVAVWWVVHSAVIT